MCLYIYIIYYIYIIVHRLKNNVFSVGAQQIYIFIGVYPFFAREQFHLTMTNRLRDECVQNEKNTVGR